MKAVPYIVLAMLVVLTVLLFFYRQPKEFDGRVSLSYRDKIPYGTYAAYHLLSQEFPKAVIETNRDSPVEWKSLSADSSKQVLFIVTKFYNEFFTITRHYEYIWYGKFDISKTLYGNLKNDFLKVQSKAA